MTRANAWLLDFKADVHSQTGEDGIVDHVLNLLPGRDSWCVEFGAWDGRQFSNSRNLIENRAYSAVLIEGDWERFQALTKNYHDNSRVIPLNQFVGFGEQDNLDKLLAQTPIPRDFDFLSIDIDGNDYHVWKALAEYQPKLVCIEFNPTIPTEVDFVQAADFSTTQGCSLSSLAVLGKSKGYELISVLPFNAFFVRAEYFPLFEISDNSPAALRKNLEYITYIFSGYDGRIFLRGNQRMLWHNLELKESKVQHLPKYLRIYPGNYTKARQALFDLCKKYLW